MAAQRAFSWYERNWVEAIQSILQPGDIFIDVGAHQGYFTLIAAQRVGPKGRVIAIEPEPTNLYWLKRNLELNSFQNVSIIPALIGEQDGKANLFISAVSSWHTLHPGENDRIVGQQEIDQKKLDTLVNELQLKKIKAIKIDVEGAERNVLEGAENTISQRKDLSVFLELHSQMGVAIDEIIQFFREHNYYLINAKNLEIRGIGDVIGNQLIAKSSRASAE